jgi:hypothetical protein
MIVNSARSTAQPASAFRFLLFTLFLFTLIASVLLFHNEAFCAQVTLAWDPESASGLAGYRVHYGTASRNYPFAVDAGNRTTATITGLIAGTTYYFAATAYDPTGTESALSNEIAYTVPSPCSSTMAPATTSLTSAAGAGSVTVTTQSTCNWTTSNPASWVTIMSGASGTGSGTVKYSVSANTGSSSRTAALTVAGAIFTITQAGGASASYTVTSSAGTGGSISPAGQVAVGQGASQSFTITPASGYSVAAVTVDGVSVGAVTSYTFSNVTANHTIGASFAGTVITYALTVRTKGTGRGTVAQSPSGSSFPVGTVVTLTATPGWNSRFSGWSGACSGTSRTCWLTITSNASVTATFAFGVIW